MNNTTRVIKTYKTLLKNSSGEFYCKNRTISIKRFPKEYPIHMQFAMCTFEDCVFDDIDMFCCQFEKCYFNHCSFRNTKMKACAFRMCDFFGTDFVGIEPVNSIMEFCHARFSVILNSNLSGMPIYNSILTIRQCMNIHVPQIVPEIGSFIGWKKAYIKDIKGLGSAIVKLQIPANARRSSFGRKCRCDRAKVLEIYGYKYKYGLKNAAMKEKVYVDHAASIFDPEFVYVVGKTVKVDDFNEECNECSEGIHFFLSEQEAIDYR